MQLIFITGAPGSGKSTALKRLGELGHTAFGADEHGLSQWINRMTGEAAVPPEEFDVHEWYKEHEWKINSDGIEKLKHQMKAGDHPVFICGVGDGIDEAWRYFDQVIVLTADEAVLRQRIMERKGNSFGKSPAELKIVLEWQNKHAPLYQGRGAALIDTTNESVEETVDKIYSSASGHR